MAQRIRLQVAETLAAIQERHTEVTQLEKQLMDLHQIFLDMGVLVESQGELLNNIEAQVCQILNLICLWSKLLTQDV